MTKVHGHDATFKVAGTKDLKGATVRHPTNHRLEIGFTEHVMQLFRKCHFVNLGNDIAAAADIGLVGRYARKVSIATVKLLFNIEVAFKCEVACKCWQQCSERTNEKKNLLIHIAFWFVNDLNDTRLNRELVLGILDAFLVLSSRRAATAALFFFFCFASGAIRSAQRLCKFHHDIGGGGGGGPNGPRRLLLLQSFANTNIASIVARSSVGSTRRACDCFGCGVFVIHVVVV
jgi:hypothetical protein